LNNYNTYDHTILQVINIVSSVVKITAHTNKTEQHAEEPFITIGAIASIFYFGWYLVIVPVVGIVENTLSDLDVPVANTSTETAPATASAVRS
jgi:hypothetical protein